MQVVVVLAADGNIDNVSHHRRGRGGTKLLVAPEKIVSSAVYAVLQKLLSSSTHLVAAMHGVTPYHVCNPTILSLRVLACVVEVGVPPMSLHRVG